MTKNLTKQSILLISLGVCICSFTAVAFSPFIGA